MSRSTQSQKEVKTVNFLFRPRIESMADGAPKWSSLPNIPTLSEKLCFPPQCCCRAACLRQRWARISISVLSWQMGTGMDVEPDTVTMTGAANSCEAR